jgi:hypothetical protein
MVTLADTLLRHASGSHAGTFNPTCPACTRGKDSFDPSEPRRPDGKWTKGGVSITSAPHVVAMPELPEKLQAKIGATMEKLTGVDEATLGKRVRDNLIERYHKGNKAHADWYRTEGEDLGRRAEKYGLSREQFTGMVAVTSAQKRWQENKDFAEGIARKLHDDEPFELTQDQLDNYNGWVSNRRGTDMVAHPEIKPGTYRPSDLPSDIAYSVTPGMPKHLNSSFVVSAIRIYRGEDTVNTAVNGPKQRSFVNNLARPDDDRYVTVDTWHYRAAMGDTKLKGQVKGRSYNYSLAEWESRDLARTDGRAEAYGYDPAKPIGDKANIAAVIKATKTPQDFFQSGPSSAADNYKGSYGTYPWFVAQTRAAADEMGVSPNALQAVAWYAEGGGA